MITTFSLATTNPYIAALEEMFRKSTKPIEWLVISHNDMQMINSLSAALPSETTVILEVSQDIWDPDEKILAEAIEWVLQHYEIKNLVLAGNSRTGGADCRASFVGPESREKDKIGFAKLLAGVQLLNNRNRDAQLRFASHFQRISEHSAVQSRWSRGELALFGLFYRFESGSYLSYDVESDSFIPLVQD